MKNLSTYRCNECGMSVKTSCGQCDIPLENGVLTLDDGTQVQISQCPSCEGKIKSPQCCGLDMTCTI